MWLCAQTPQPELLVLVNGERAAIEKNTLNLKSSDYLVILDTCTATASATYQYQLKNTAYHFLLTQTGVATYTKLKEGTYDFSVCSCAQEEAVYLKRFQIIVANSYISEWWFIPMLIFYLLLLFGGAIYFILLSNFRAKDTMLNARNDWSLRLHNKTLNDLNAIKGRLEILLRQLGNINESAANNIQTILFILQTVQKKVRFVFNVLDPDKDALQIMLKDLEAEALLMLNPQNIALDYHNNLQAEDNLRIDPRRVDHLYQLINEAIGNIAKHSQATQASLHIRREPLGLFITVKDNGKGFDLQTICAGGGISNFRKWEKEGVIGIKIESAPREGTTIQMSVPEL